MYSNSNLITSPIPIFWNRINGSLSIFYIYPYDSSSSNININSIISLPLELYNNNNSLDSSFDYLIQNNYLTSLPQKLANVWKMIGWCYNKTHVIDSTLMRNYYSVIELKSKLLEKTNKEKSNFFMNCYQEILIDKKNENNYTHPITNLPLQVVDIIVKKLNNPDFLPNIENEFFVNKQPSFMKFPKRPRPLIHTTPQTITFGSSLNPSLQAALQNIQDSFLPLSNTPTEVSTTAQASDTNETDLNSNENSDETLAHA